MNDTAKLLTRIKDLQDKLKFQARLDKKWQEGETRRRITKETCADRERCRALFVRMGFKSSTATELIKQKSLVKLLSSCLALERKMKEKKP